MAVIAYGDKVSETDEEVRYRVASPDDEEGTLLVIPVADPDSSYIEGKTGRLLPGERGVLVKAHRAHRETGEWPERVSFYA